MQWVALAVVILVLVGGTVALVRAAVESQDYQGWGLRRVLSIAGLVVLVLVIGSAFAPRW